MGRNFVFCARHVRVRSLTKPADPIKSEFAPLCSTRSSTIVQLVRDRILINSPVIQLMKVDAHCTLPAEAGSHIRYRTVIGATNILLPILNSECIL
jgi:hypothetical protein